MSNTTMHNFPSPRKAKQKAEIKEATHPALLPTAQEKVPTPEVLTVSPVWAQLAGCQLSKWFIHFGPTTNWQNLFMFPSKETWKGNIICLFRTRQSS